MASLIFHTARVGGRILEAFITSEGPLLTIKGSPFSQAELGVSVLRYAGHAEGEFGPPGPGWWIAKYGNDYRIHLPGIGQAEAEEIAQEFGVPIWTPTISPHSAMTEFYRGRAWDGLKIWIRKNPIVARRLSRGHPHYLPQWYEAAAGDGQALDLTCTR